MLVSGVDIIEVNRIQAVVERWGQRYLQRIYTEAELAYCRGRPSQLATRFAAKEAVMKALGTGVRGVSWKEIEVKRERGRAPEIELHGRTLKRAQDLGIKHLAVSLSHSEEYAVAFVVGERIEDSQR